jgi:hypothetical protein
MQFNGDQKLKIMLFLTFDLLKNLLATIWIRKSKVEKCIIINF